VGLELMTRYEAKGGGSVRTSLPTPEVQPQCHAPEVVDLVVDIHERLSHAGLDTGAETIAWHLHHTHNTAASRAAINRILTGAGLVVSEPKKRPRSSYIGFEANAPNECWQSDFTRYHLTHPDGRPGEDADIITQLDDHSRSPCTSALTGVSPAYHRRHRGLNPHPDQQRTRAPRLDADRQCPWSTPCV
jgi:hypothetical protein